MKGKKAGIVVGKYLTSVPVAILIILILAIFLLFAANMRAFRPSISAPASVALSDQLTDEVEISHQFAPAEKLTIIDALSKAIFAQEKTTEILNQITRFPENREALIKEKSNWINYMGDVKKAIKEKLETDFKNQIEGRICLIILQSKQGTVQPFGSVPGEIEIDEGDGKDIFYVIENGRASINRNTAEARKYYDKGYLTKIDKVVYFDASNQKTKEFAFFSYFGECMP